MDLRKVCLSTVRNRSIPFNRARWEKICVFLLLRSGKRRGEIIVSVRPLGAAPPFLPIRFRPLSLTRDIVVCVRACTHRRRRPSQVKEEGLSSVRAPEKAKTGCEMGGEKNNTYHGREAGNKKEREKARALSMGNKIEFCRASGAGQSVPRGRKLKPKVVFKNVLTNIIDRYTYKN